MSFAFRVAPRPGPARQQPLLMIHGFGESHRVWEAQVTAFADRYDVMTWDLPGHGERAGEFHPGLDMEQLTEQLLTVVRSCAGPPVLVGHSVGGYLALRCVISAGADVRTLVLIGAVPGFRTSEQMSDWNGRIDRVTALLGLPAEIGRSIHMTDAMVAESLTSVPCPALVLFGDEDRDIYQCGGRYLAENIPDARLLVIRGAQHSPHRSHAAEVNAAITDFMDGIATRPAGPAPR